VEDERILSLGLTAGVLGVLLAFSSWHAGWWRSQAAPVARSQFYATDARPTNPFAPKSEFTPAPVARTTFAEAARSEPQSDDSTPEVDYEALIVERNRGVEHGSRTH
jgi:hypothetical protein